MDDVHMLDFFRRALIQAGREDKAERLFGLKKVTSEITYDVVQVLYNRIRELTITPLSARATPEYTAEQVTAAVINPAQPMLEKALATYAERRARYGASEQKFADIALAMFPKGLRLESRSDWVRFGLFFQIISKLSRYTNDFNKPHVDSIHDAPVYAFMLEAEDRRLLRMSPFDFQPPPILIETKESIQRESPGKPSPGVKSSDGRERAIQTHPRGRYEIQYGGTIDGYRCTDTHGDNRMDTKRDLPAAIQWLEHVSGERVDPRMVPGHPEFE